DLGDGFGAGLDLIGDGFEESRAGFAAGIAIGPKGLFGLFGRLCHQIDGADREFMHRTMRRFAVKTGRAGDPFARDQMLSMRGEGHGRVLSGSGAAMPKAVVGSIIVEFLYIYCMQEVNRTERHPERKS